MGPTQESGYLSEKLDKAWDRRVEAANDWNAKLEKGEIQPGILKRIRWNLQALFAGMNYRNRRAALAKQWRDVDGRREASLAWSMNDVFGDMFWIAGCFKVGCLLFRIFNSI